MSNIVFNKAPQNFNSVATVGYSKIVISHVQPIDIDISSRAVWLKAGGAAKSTAALSVQPYEGLNYVLIDTLTSETTYDVAVALVDLFAATDTAVLDSQYKNTANIITIEELTGLVTKAPVEITNVVNTNTDQGQIGAPPSTVTLSLTGYADVCTIEASSVDTPGVWFEVFSAPVTEDKDVSITMAAGEYSFRAKSTVSLGYGITDTSGYNVYAGNTTVGASTASPETPTGLSVTALKLLGGKVIYGLDLSWSWAVGSGGLKRAFLLEYVEYDPSTQTPATAHWSNPVQETSIGTAYRLIGVPYRKSLAIRVSAKGWNDNDSDYLYSSVFISEDAGDSGETGYTVPVDSSTIPANTNIHISEQYIRGYKDWDGSTGTVTFNIDAATGDVTIGAPSVTYGGEAPLVFDAANGVLSIKGQAVVDEIISADYVMGWVSGQKPVFRTANRSSSSAGYSENTSGIWMGYINNSNTDFRFSLGNSTDYIRWNGSALEISSSLVVGTPGKDGTSNAYYNGFETDADQVNLQIVNGSKTVSSTAFSGSNAILLSNNVAVNSSGQGSGAFIEIPESLALLFAGQTVRVSAIIKQAATNTSTSFGMIYNTNDVGNSSLQTFTVPATYTKVSFDYTVPLPSAGGVDYLQIYADTTGSGKAVLIDDIQISITGQQGASAYEVWKVETNQPAATEQDFLDSLVGSDGQSAYQLWLLQPGNSGKTETEFLNSLDGADGNTWYTLGAAPSAGLGVDGDFALVSGRYIYSKSSGTWAQIADTKGADAPIPTVTRNGNEVTISVPGGGSAVVYDGDSAPIPILTQNPDGSYTIDNQDGDTLTIPPVIAVGEPWPSQIGGSTNLLLTPNKGSAGTDNPGEIKFSVTKLVAPDGTVVSLAATAGEIITPYEGTIHGRFYIVYSATAPRTRFSDSTNLSAGNFFPAYYQAGNWYCAKDNNVGVQFTPLSTDILLAVCTSVDGYNGISSLTPLYNNTVFKGVDYFDGLDGSFYSFIYKVVYDDVTPSTPTGGSFNGTSETIPSGWSDNPVFSGLGTEWVSSTKYTQQSNGSWTNSGWSAPAVNARTTSTNLVNPNWVVGNTGNHNGWTAYGTTAENLIVLEPGPSELTETCWRGNGSNGGDDGGCRSDVYGIDMTKTHRFSAWVKTTNASGWQLYFGSQPSNNQILNLSTSAVNTNPYFLNNKVLPQANKWYLMVGVVHGSGYSGTSVTGYAGLYDPETGERVIAGDEFKFNSAATSSTGQIRLRRYGATSAGNTYFTRPRVEVMDGNEPSLSELFIKKLTRGAGTFTASYSGTWPASFNNTLAGVAASATTGGVPAYNDVVTVYSAADPSKQYSVRFLGGTANVSSSWEQFQLVIHGSALVQGTVVADEVVANISISAPEITGGKLSIGNISGSNKQVIIDSTNTLSPITIRDAYGDVLAFRNATVTDEDGNRVTREVLFLKGGLGTNTIDTLDVFTPEMRALIVPTVSGDTGGIASLSSSVSVSPTAQTNTDISLAFPNDKSLTISYTFRDHNLSRELGSASEDITPYIPVWKIWLQRQVDNGVWTTLSGYPKTFTGEYSTDPDAADPNDPKPWSNPSYVGGIYVTETINETGSTIGLASDGSKPVAYRLITERQSGDYAAPKVNALSISQEVDGGGISGVASAATFPYIELVKDGVSTSIPKLSFKNNPATDPKWLRVSDAAGGILPYSNGNGYLGTNTWRFSEVHSNQIYLAGSTLASTFTTKNEFTAYSTQVLNVNGSTCTTAQFITHLENLGMFDNYHSVLKTSWDYANNSNITDGPEGETIELAGCVIETFTDNASDTTRGNITVRVTCPNTGASPYKVYVYVDQGSTYSPGWRKMITSAELPSVAYVPRINSTQYITADWYMRKNDTGLIVRSQNSSASNANQFLIQHNGGNVDIGNNRGNIRFTCAVTSTSTITATDIGATSDISVKDNIRKIDGALDKVKQIGGWYFNRNDMDNKPSAGTIAQYVEAVFPEATYKYEDGKLGLVIPAMIGLLLQAVVELEERNG